MSNTIWKDFEKNIVHHSKAQRIYVTKIPEAVRFIGQGKYVHTSTGFDFAAGIDGIAAFFDAKTTDHEKLYFTSLRRSDEKKPGKQRRDYLHQWHALEDCHHLFNIAGYLIYFAPLKTITWLNIGVANNLLRSGHTFVSPDSPGTISQRDSDPINLRKLLWEDRAYVLKKLLPSIQF